MYNSIMKGIRGGFVHHWIANNKYLKNDYDCDKESNYGYAMTQKKNFKYVEKTEEGNFKNVDLLMIN